MGTEPLERKLAAILYAEGTFGTEANSLIREKVNGTVSFRSIRHLPWQKQHSAVAKNQQRF